MQIVENKKSAIDLQDLAIGIVILGIVVAIGATILTTMRNSQVTTLPTYRVVNETLTGVHPAGDALSTIWVQGINDVTNSTGGTVINSGNYTLSIDSGTGVGTVYGIGTGLFNNTDWKVTYTVYNVSDVRFNTPNKASIGLAEYGNWFDILVIVGIASVVIALIYMAFNRGSSGGTAY